ncbi:helix-turn-helix transcriptional regulator [Lachnospiraceae bacterium NSJ-143]|nr:helix-turn-helix transcriptional regulator [Lachnospiraceae bacterium NSJ-143]
MYEPKTEKDIRCPLEYAMGLFGGKWKSRILCVINSKETVRYSELKNELAGVTDTVLAAALKELVTDNLVIRVQYNEVPMRVEYSLTATGKSIIPLLWNICQWADIRQRETNGPLICNRCDYTEKERQTN